MDDKDVWLYQVIDHKNMSCSELQNLLDRWSNNPAPHELLICEDKMIVRYMSGFTRSAFFANKFATTDTGFSPGA